MAPDSTSTLDGNLEDASLYTRRATGLVRQVSPRSALFFNTLTAPAPFVLALAIFFVFGVAPGGNLYLALIVGYLFGAVMAFTVSVLTSALPRSGGDYILVSRIMHPVVGLISSFCNTAGVLLSAAWFAVILSSIALGPALTVLGLISGSSTLVNAGNTVATSKGWILGLGIVAVLFCGAVIAAGWKWSLRLQAIGLGAALLGLLVTYVVLIFTSHSGFVSSFNHFASPFTHQSNSYAYMIAQATKQGVQVHPTVSLGATWPSLAAVMGFCMFGWFSTNIAGEVRQAKTWKTSMTMVGAVLLNLVLVVIGTALFFHVFGSDFFRAINGLNGSAAYPFAASPTYIFLTSISGGSSVLAGFLSFTFVIMIIAILWLQFFQPVRAIFAYAFDGVLPLGISRVSPRSRTPVLALAIVLGITCALTVWATYTTSFFTVYSTGVLLSTIPLFLLSSAAIALPWRRPQIWQGAVTTKRLLGVPILTLTGVIGIVASLLMAYLFLHYPQLGLSDRRAAYLSIVYVVGGAIVVFVVASIVRARHGISLSRAASQIPGE